ncbi:MAG: NUMOD4 domain-containing protein [Methanosphaera sp.]|nr:NUMOD4 domain-containing protein [Methanosphaera sp.]
MKEIWKDIKGYESLYQVSNLGRVKSLARKVIKTNYVSFKKERILKQQTDRYGYKKVILQRNYQIKTFSIHRLVAEAFLENPYNLPQINHKDENKENNCVLNLEYCDSKYNNNYGTRNKRVSETMKKKKYQYE